MMDPDEMYEMEMESRLFPSLDCDFDFETTDIDIHEEADDE